MPENVADHASQLEQDLRTLQKSGDPAAIAAAGLAAIAAIRERATGGGEADRAALTTAKRLAYNAAADCWPGWETNSPAISPATLAAARDLALRSAELVAELGLPPIQAGHAAWLVGAFDLALGHHAAALTNFAAAESSFHTADAPDLILMAAGYAALTHQAAGTAESDLDPILTQLRASTDEDGPFIADQLLTARAIFVRGDPG